MITRQTLAQKRDEILRLAEKYHVRDVRVFGSVARENNGDKSDVDFLVNTTPDCSLFDLGGLLMDLQDMLDCKVDVAVADDLKPRLRDRILREALPL
jgi:uncharacterized protein